MVLHTVLKHEASSLLSVEEGMLFWKVIFFVPRVNLRGFFLAL